MSDEQKLRDYLKRVTLELHDARASLRELESQSGEPVAIIGIGCRYPGGVKTAEQMWELVRDERDAISGWPADRGWDVERLYDPDPERTGTSYAREGGFLNDAGEFDADFFRISPREALAMDPQQRLLLEAAWEAVENAGIGPLSLRGSQTGVFIGGTANGYGLDPSGSIDEDIAGHYGTGALSSVMSGRISYSLGLEGPGLTIDTACSSSLVALHVACASLRAGESSLALVGGAAIMPTPTVFLEFSRQRGLAADGRCKSFGEGADGVGWSEGVGVLALERLSDARGLGHPVLALVRSSAVNQDGASNGLTAPNGPSQQRVIRAALANAKLAPHQVDAVEAHGTGTTLGDPIEAQALLATYGQGRPQGRPLWLGSIKSNIGHTQAAAGIAGVIKVAMALRYGLLPKTLHAERPSREVDWSAGAVSLLTESVPWPREGEPRRAGVSSFGVSGTNAHVIIEEADTDVLDRPARNARKDSPRRHDTAHGGLLGGGALALILSARGEPALGKQAAGMSAFLEENPDLEPLDVCFSLTRRSALDTRAVAITEQHDGLPALLDSIARGERRADVLQGAIAPEAAGEVVFVFPGQGSQWAGMALELSERSEVFAARLSECAAALEPLVDWSLQSVLADVSGALLERVEVVQPALFAVMVALAELWRACGVQADAVVGHSQGEIAAACVAGALSLEDGARVVVARSRALVALAGAGGMVALACDAQQAEALIGDCEGELALASVNGPRSSVISGEPSALARLLERCQQEGVKAREIPVDYAAHSPQVERIRDELLAGCAGIAPRRGSTPFYSAVSAGLLDGEQLDPEYWYRNLREPVQFERVTQTLLEEGYRTFIEVSPHPVLAVGMHETVEQALSQGPGAQLSSPSILLGSLRRGEGGPRRFLSSLAEAWVRGVQVDWQAVFKGSGAQAVSLPTYAFQRRRYWLESKAGAPGAAPAGQVSVEHPFVSAGVPQAEADGWLFTGRISLEDQTWIADHAAAGIAIVPGTTFVDIALCVGAQVGCEVVEDFVHETPLALTEQCSEVQLQVAIGPAEEGGRRTIGLFTRPEQGAGTEQEWTRHVGGVLAPAAAAGMDQLASPADQAGADAWPPRDAEALSVEEIYDYYAALGLEYGPAFLSIRAAWQRGEEVFTEVRLPEHECERARGFKIHPALLDASLQACGVLMRAVDPATPEHGVLPFAWTRMRLHTDGCSSVRVHLTRSELGGYRLLVLDEQGCTVACADSVVLRKVTPELLRLRQMSGAGSDSLHRLQWVSIAPNEIPAPAGELVVARLGGESPRAQDLPAASRVILEQALKLVRDWLSETRPEGSRLVLVTKRTVSTSSEEGIADLAAAPLWGLVRSAQSEHPARFVLLDLDEDPDEPTDLDALAATLDRSEPQIALRAGELLAPRLTRVKEAPTQIVSPAGDEEPSGLAGEESSGLPGDPEQSVAAIGLTASGQPGSVLITGGSGLIGAALAKHLVGEHGVRSVMLAGRRGRQAPGAKSLEAELSELGAQVKILACDVSDREQVEQLIAATPSEYPLSAVVHAAGVLDDGVIDSMTIERIDRVLAPKLDGAWHLHELTADLDLSAFILCSAGAGTLGSPGQSNYAAANAFLDALAAHRRERGLPASSIAWGLWAGGLAGELSDDEEKRLRHTGVLALSVEEGLSLFDAAQRLDEPLLLPMRLDIAALRSLARSAAIPPLLKGLVRVPAPAAPDSARQSLVRRLASTPESERGRVALELVRAEVASVLGHDSPEAIAAERAFSELGFDSLTAIELRNRLIAVSGIQLPATLAFDYPSPAALSDFLLEQISQEVAGQADSPPSEIDIRGAFASIPLKRLREAGVLDTLMTLAGVADGAASEAEENELTERVEEMDVESLIEFSLGADSSLQEGENEPVEGSKATVDEPALEQLR